MKALFGRKFYNIKELREATEEAKKDGVIGSEYTVIREVELSDSEFEKLTSDFLEDQPWIRKSDGGTNERRTPSSSKSTTKRVYKRGHPDKGLSLVQIDNSGLLDRGLFHSKFIQSSILTR